MPRFGDVFENHATGERVVVLRGSRDPAARGAEPGLAHLRVVPGGTVAVEAGEHVHPVFNERVTVLRGRIAARVAGRRMTLGPGEGAFIEAGLPHDWGNASPTEEAQVLVEITAAPGAGVDLSRFELLIATLLGLANDGRLGRGRRPSRLHAAVLAHEFADVMAFTRPGPAVLRPLLALLAPVGRRLGHRALEPRHARPHAQVVPEPWVLSAAGLGA